MLANFAQAKRHPTILPKAISVGRHDSILADALDIYSRAMNGLQLELERLRRQNQETAQYACLLADAFGERLPPTVLQDVQTAVRQNLRYVEHRLNSLEWRRRRRTEVISKRFKGTSYFRDCRSLHLKLLRERENRLTWQRNMLRQVGDTLAWIVLRRDPSIVSALYASRTHQLPDLEGLLGPTVLVGEAHATGTLLVIDNDLTRCLGTGDLTVVSNDDQWHRPVAIEVKSSLAEDGAIEIRAFGPSGNDPSDDRLFKMLHEAFGVAGGTPHDLAPRNKKQSDDMLLHARVLHAFTAELANRVGDGSEVRWQVLENVLSKALQLGSSADVVDGIVYLGVRNRPGDDAPAAMTKLHDFLEWLGIGRGYQWATSVDFQQNDYASAFIPPIPLWRLSRPVRAALMSGELLSLTAYKPSIWSEAFIKHEIMLVETDRGWKLTKGGKTVVLGARDNRVVRYALAFVGLSPSRVAENLADVFAA